MTLAFSLAFLALTCATVGLALYRKLVARNEDDFLHVNAADVPVVARQAQVAHRLEVVDRWGQTFTVITIVVGVVLAALYIFQKWNEGLQLNY